jgi:hypothetical protein
MVDMKTETRTHNHQDQHDQKPVNPRDAIREQRQRRLRVINSGKTPTIKVYAANETMRGALRHPSGARFRTKIDQPVEWPNDTFTSRRIKEGSVRTERTDGAMLNLVFCDVFELRDAKIRRLVSYLMEIRHPNLTL